MDQMKFEQIKAMVEDWDEEWGCGPFEDCIPEETDLRKLNTLTGQNWTAEDVRLACFEYSSHHSLEETAYFLLYGDYPPANSVNLVFYQLKPGAALDPESVYEKYRLGNQMKALRPLPMEEITDALRNLSGFQEHPWGAYKPENLRMDCTSQPDPWSDVHFWAFWYGGRKNPRPDHLLCLACHNMTETQIESLKNCLSRFDISLQYREDSKE